MISGSAEASGLRIIEDNLDGTEIATLLRFHLEGLHLMAEARRCGYTRRSLETGRPEAFLPARRIYAANGFAECPPFGDYVSDAFSLCMTRLL